MITARDRYLMSRYSINEAQYQQLLLAVGSGCWICGRRQKTRRLHVDHDHKTGRVRGILCARCNRGLVYYHDNPKLMRAAATYLESDLAQRVLLQSRDAGHDDPDQQGEPSV